MLGTAEEYTSVEAKAAALFHSLVKNHAFHNGNKRTALVSMLAFLEKNERRLRADVSDDDVFEIVVGVAEGVWPSDSSSADDTVDAVATWLRDHSTARTAKVSAMRVTDFLSKCEKAGLRVTEAGGWRVQGDSGSVTFCKATRELTGSVIKVYLRKIGLTESKSGVAADSFRRGSLKMPTFSDAFRPCSKSLRTHDDAWEHRHARRRLGASI